MTLKVGTHLAIWTVVGALACLFLAEPRAGATSHDSRPIPVDLRAKEIRLIDPQTGERTTRLTVSAGEAIELVFEPVIENLSEVTATVEKEVKWEFKPGTWTCKKATIPPRKHRSFDVEAKKVEREDGAIRHRDARSGCTVAASGEGSWKEHELVAALLCVREDLCNNRSLAFLPSWDKEDLHEPAGIPDELKGELRKRFVGGGRGLFATKVEPHEDGCQVTEPREPKGAYNLVDKKPAPYRLFGPCFLDLHDSTSIKGQSEKAQRDRFWSFQPEPDERTSSNVLVFNAVFYVEPGDGFVDVNPANDVLFFEFEIEIIGSGSER